MPVVAEFVEGLVYCILSLKALDHASGLFLADHPGGFPLVRRVVFHVPEKKNQSLSLPGSKTELQMVGGDWSPTMGHRVPAFAPQNRLGSVKSVVQPQKALTISVKAGDRLVDRVEGEVIAPFTILALVVDRRALHLHFGQRQIPLEVGHIIQGVPEAKLDQGEQLHGSLPLASVLQCELVDLRVYAQGNEEQYLRRKIILASVYKAVAQTMAALVLVQLRPDRFPAR